jgi:HAD superfamily hydrolase (TIGR01509 family)
MPIAFDAVLFDCDGVLVDSEPIANRVLTHSLNRLGLALTQAETEHHFVGLPLLQSMARIEALLGRSLPADWYPQYQAERDKALTAELQPVAGIVALLQHLQDKRIPMAVASGAEREKLDLNLRLTGLGSYFGPNTFSGSDVERSKPAPDVYLLAARKLGIEPRRCAVIEDTATGTRAGVAAGMTVFGYGARNDAQSLRDAGASRVFGDMAELPSILM